MDFSVLTEYVVVTVWASCLCIGFCIKTWNKVPNHFIPTILVIIGVFFAVWINGWSITPEIVLNGMMSALTAVGTHQLFYQYIYKSKEVEAEEAEYGTYIDYEATDDELYEEEGAEDESN